MVRLINVNVRDRISKDRLSRNYVYTASSTMRERRLLLQPYYCDYLHIQTTRLAVSIVV